MEESFLTTKTFSPKFVVITGLCAVLIAVVHLTTSGIYFDELKPEWDHCRWLPDTKENKKLCQPIVGNGAVVLLAIIFTIGQIILITTFLGWWARNKFRRNLSKTEAVLSQLSVLILAAIITGVSVYYDGSDIIETLKSGGNFKAKLLSFQIASCLNTIYPLLATLIFTCASKKKVVKNVPIPPSTINSNMDQQSRNWSNQQSQQYSVPKPSPNFGNNPQQQQQRSPAGGTNLNAHSQPSYPPSTFQYDGQRVENQRQNWTPYPISGAANHDDSYYVIPRIGNRQRPF